MGAGFTWQWSSVTPYWDEVWKGLLLTLQISAISFVAAFAIGLLGAVAKRSRITPFRIIASMYVEAFRNTPCLLQIFIAYFVMPSVGFRVDNVAAGEIAISLNIGAYMTEVFRAGLQSIPLGQLEAASSLALPKGQIFRRVVLPQALRNIYPPLINMATTTLLASTLLTGIAVSELLGTAINIQALTFRPIEIFSVITVIYIALTFIVSGDGPFGPANVFSSREELGHAMGRRLGQSLAVARWLPDNTRAGGHRHRPWHSFGSPHCADSNQQHAVC